MKLYHQTTFAAATSIAKHGIKIDCSKTWQGRGGCIYLAEYLPSIENPEMTFRVDITNLEVTRISDWEHVCWDNIPVNRIILICPSKLIDGTPCYSPVTRNGFCGHHHPDFVRVNTTKWRAQQEATK